MPTVTGVSPNSGSTTNPTAGITVTGSGFDNVTPANNTIAFGTVAGTVTAVASATSLTATAPAQGSGTVHVRVTTAGATSAEFPPFDQFTYVGSPTVTGMAPTNGIKTGGAPVSISGTNFSGATRVTFGGVDATFAVNSSTQITASSPPFPAGGTVDVRVTNNEGTSSINRPGDVFMYL